MTMKDTKNSVRNEPFGEETENMHAENPTGKKAQNSGKSRTLSTSGEKEDPNREEHAEDAGNDVGMSRSGSVPAGSSTGKAEEKPVEGNTPDDPSEKETAGMAEEKDTASPTDEVSADESGDPDLTEVEEREVPEEAQAEKSEEKRETEVSEPEEKEEVTGENQEEEAVEEVEEEEERPPHETESRQQKEEEMVNYNLLSREDLVGMLDDLISGKNITDIRDDVEAIKIAYYRKQRTETESARDAFVAGGGDPSEFELSADDLELKFRDLLKRYKELKFDVSHVDDDEKESNLREKYKIIDEIGDLVNRDESINKTFQEFRELQKRWHDIGIVPQQSLKDLWETYHYHVEKFYDYIKINKELRDLDLKKNLEAKIELCEKAEALLLEPNVVNAFQMLQRYHDQWREIGPVPKDKRTEIWDRFKDATSKINKKHQQYYQELKEAQKKNLESKTILCEKAEELAGLDPDTHDEWVGKTGEMFELQKVWKTIGFAPKKDNNRIYARFRAACDLFFEKKREFYAQNMEEQQNHLQQKLDLCVQAEALQNSTDWKNATDELIRLQKKWKSIGPVPRKFSDEVWKRFRAACDTFFNRKADYFSKIDTTYEKNLKDKEALIQEIKDFILTDNQKQNLKQLNDFQRQWSEIGFVPFEKKDEIMQEYREAINSHFDNLEMDDHKKSMLKFRNKLDNIRQKPRPSIKMRFEREKLMNKLQQLRSDISLWENNIGFFANSQSAETMVKDFERKISSARDKIKLLEEKIILIDELDSDEE